MDSSNWLSYKTKFQRYILFPPAEEMIQPLPPSNGSKACPTSGMTLRLRAMVHTILKEDPLYSKNKTREDSLEYPEPRVSKPDFTGYNRIQKSFFEL
jgi:hypothetical protein